MSDLKSQKQLSDFDKSKYEWQIWMDDLGEEGQKKLKNSTVLISRAGGLGGVVAFELAAAGIGHLIIAHAGNLKPSDLNRQILMREDGLGQPRVEAIQKTLHAFNPNLKLTLLSENISKSNVSELVGNADVIVDAAPLFEERFAMNDEAFRQKKPIVECAMYDMEFTLTTMMAGKTPCLRCLHPERPKNWKREFPVLGAVSGTVACLAATEVIKVIANIGEPLMNSMLLADLRDMHFDKVPISVRKGCTCHVSS